MLTGRKAHALNNLNDRSVLDLYNQARKNGVFLTVSCFWTEVDRRYIDKVSFLMFTLTATSTGITRYILVYIFSNDNTFIY